MYSQQSYQKNLLIHNVYPQFLLSEENQYNLQVQSFLYHILNLAFIFCPFQSFSYEILKYFIYLQNLQFEIIRVFYSYLYFQQYTQSPQHNQVIMTIGKLKLKQTIKTNSSVGSGFRPKKSKQEKQEIQKIFDEKLKTKDKVFSFEPIQGTGMIVTSGTSLLGKQTKFNTQVTKGDYIQIQNPLLKTIEQRPVMAVLGPNSILLSEPFLQQFSTYTKYIIKRSPKVIEGQDISLEYKKKMEQLKLQKTKQINKQTLDLRIKKGMWGYEKQTVDISKGASKQQLLDIRAKKIKDKHCW